MAKSSQSAKTLKNKSTVRNSRTTVSGPAEPDASGAGDILAEKASFPFNPNKAAEYDPDEAVAPPEGASVKPADSIVGASTVTELNGSHKVGSGSPNIGKNPTVGPLDRMRVDSTDRLLTTNQGVPVGDNQNSLKAGLRGPTLLEDFKTALAALADRLTNEGAVPRFVSSALGPVQPAAGNAFEVDVSMEAAPTVLYDALVLPDGDQAITALRADGRTLEFIKDQYRHCKPILALGGGEQLLRACGIDGASPDGQQDPGLIIASDTSAAPGRLRRGDLDASALRQRNPSATRMRICGCGNPPN